MAEKQRPADQAALTRFSLPATLYEDTGKKRFRWRYLDASCWEKYTVLPAPQPPSSIPSTLPILRSCLKKHSNPQ